MPLLFCRMLRIVPALNIWGPEAFDSMEWPICCRGIDRISGLPQRFGPPEPPRKRRSEAPCTRATKVLLTWLFPENFFPPGTMRASRRGNCLNFQGIWLEKIDNLPNILCLQALYTSNGTPSGAEYFSLPSNLKIVTSKEIQLNASMARWTGT
ncbi:hypothetical protein [Poseidonocella sp. HB161398]|uniref:hypothetical protein n=1 Tax=Poseidonocella sp. HB161398 TaxID=2320855 RepID=UPI0011080CF5|nr:hypothetical protein [Poseidonocella sp. HB161398]